MPNESEIESVRIKREPYGLWLQRYEEVGMLIEDRVAVKRDGKWGFIDETGQEIIPLSTMKQVILKNDGSRISTMKFLLKYR